MRNFGELNKYVQLDEDTRSKTLGSDEVKEDDDKHYILRIRKQLSGYKTDFELWNFLIRNSEILNSIKDWTIYRRAVEVGIEPTTTLTTTLGEEAYALLKSGKIDEFNKKKEFRIDYLNLSKTDLGGANLSGANLSGADLSDSIIINTMHEKVILDIHTNFAGAVIDDTNFIDIISGFTKNVPEKIENKKALKRRLSERVPKINETFIMNILSSSKLPE